MKTNKVILFGTRHLPGDEFPEYFEKLKSIIIEINPDIICSELSPEQLAGTCSCNSKPEQRDVVIPLAHKMDIPIIPLQPPLNEGLSREKRKNNIIESIESSAKKPIWEFIADLTLNMSQHWRRLMKNPECIEISQLTEFHVFAESIDCLMDRHFSQFNQYYEEGNNYFLNIINNVLDKNSKKIIMIIIGFGHKYWLWNKLQLRNDIELHNLQSYRIAKSSNQ
jgi:hypothetical protein